MKRLLLSGIAFLLCLIANPSVHARGGGGCLIQGTAILTPRGNVPIESLKQGDTVFSVRNGKLAPAIVQALTQVEAQEFVRVAVRGGAVLLATHEHPIQIQFGVFRMASAIKPGDQIHIADGQKIATASVNSVSRVSLLAPAYNLLVSHGGNYIANGIAVHNKGCFLPDTPIKKADGTDVPISAIKRNDRVLAVGVDGKVVQTTVRDVLVHDVDEYNLLRAGDIILRVTSEHPFYVGDGTFKSLEALKPNDDIFVFTGSGLERKCIESIETVHQKTHVYNLQTDAPHTFLVNGVLVHNKGGGCFPAGTKITTPAGELPIEQIKEGAAVIAVDHNGKQMTTVVKELHKRQSQLLLVHTSSGTLRTTDEHPLALRAGGFRPAGALQPGDEIITLSNSKLGEASVKKIGRPKVSEEVYNLTVDWPHTFVADGFVVHNKGGGGFRGSGGGYRSSGGSGGPFEVFITFIVIFGVIYYIVDGIRNTRFATNLDYLYSDNEVAKKRNKTMKLLTFIAKQDATVLPEALKKLTESTFLKLQECWQSREYVPMKSLLMPDLYNEHLLQIKSMVRNHEINMIANLKINKIDLVNIRYTTKDSEREFTALITATAQDYYIEDRTRTRLRGDTKPERFQEFWTFHYFNKTWLLREIEQTRESDVLKEDNLFEQFTDKAMDHIYGEEAGQQGPAGPWLEKAVETKETRIERMLNFLVQTDKLWDRKAMLLTTRNIFIKITVAWESGDAAKIPVEDLFPELAENVRKQIEENAKAKIAYEFRNLCVRKTELVLVKNYADNSKDEFVARVRAHAQKILKRDATTVHKDDDVAPFEQYLTFGRMDNRWKLKEIVSAEAAKNFIEAENIDKESSPRQMKWYYEHKTGR